MADPNRTLTFSNAYVATAGQLSNTYGSSTGTQTTFNSNGATGVVISVDAMGVPGGASEIRVTPVYYDGTTERVPRSDGTNPDYLAFTTTGMTPPFPINSSQFRLEVWLDAADATATCTVSVNFIN